MQEKNKDNSISLQDIFRVLWKNVILVAILTVAITVLGVVYTFGVAKEKFKSSSSIIVAVESQASNSSTDYDFTSSLRAVVTVSDAIKENTLLGPVAEQYKLKATALASMISVSNNSNSMKITITVTSTDADQAMNLANAIANRCVEEAKDGGLFFFAKDSIVVSSVAQKGVHASPNEKLYVLVSIVLGLVVSFVVVFFKEFMSNKYKTRAEIENQYGQKILGVFPDDKKKNPKNGDKDVTLVTPSIRAFEPYNKLLSNIKYSNLENHSKSILFTSTLTNELKSTTISNLAYCIKNNNQSIVIIDLDLRKSVLHKTFNVPRENGIVDYVAGNIDKDALIKHSECGVDVITSGMDVINPVAVVETTKLKELIKELKEEYDYVLIDTPPCLACPDAQIVSSYTDGVIFNISLNQAKKKDIQETMNNLTNVGANVIGIAITKADSKADSYYYYYYGENK